MGTGRWDDNSDDDTRMGVLFPVAIVFFQLFFFSLSHQHSQNHEQCGHAEAYSTVMLFGGVTVKSQTCLLERLTDPQLPALAVVQKKINHNTS